MKPVAAILSLIALALGDVEAVPVRRPTAPMPPTPPSHTPLAGSVWKGKLFSPEVELRFEIDGTLSYWRGDARSGGSWSLLGNKIYFEINNKASEYRGFVYGNRMIGEAENKQLQLLAEFELKRQTK